MLKGFFSDSFRVTFAKKLKLPVWVLLVAVAFLYIATQFGAAIILGEVLSLAGWGASQIQGWFIDEVFGQFMFILLVEALTVGSVFAFLKIRKLPFRVIGWDRPKLSYLPMALLGLGAYFVLYIVAASIAQVLAPSLDFEQEQQLGFEAITSNMDLLLTGISLVLLPPLAEEILFRGFLFTGLRERLKFLPAAVLTSVVFGIGHLQFGSGAPLLWAAALDTFVLSMVLCYVRERSGSLWPAILIHAIKNGIAFTVLFVI